MLNTTNSFGCFLFSWKRNARKIALAQGEATTDYKGRHIPARKTGPPCRCRRECFHKVNEGERRHILETINSMGDTTVQNMYLRGLVIGEEPKRLGAGGCKGVNKAEKERKCSLSYSYYVQTSDLKRIQVWDLVNSDTAEPLYNKVPRDWKNVFVITGLRYIEVLFHKFYHCWA